MEASFNLWAYSNQKFPLGVDGFACLIRYCPITCPNLDKHPLQLIFYFSLLLLQTIWYKGTFAPVVVSLQGYADGQSLKDAVNAS
uniref:Uncharacterized protein n=1 Tax=Salix viminalis TaxID=40686 RepID=A0A6N2K4S8_SALVM